MCARFHDVLSLLLPLANRAGCIDSHPRSCGLRSVCLKSFNAMESFIGIGMEGVEVSAEYALEGGNLQSHRPSRILDLVLGEPPAVVLLLA